MTRHFGAFKNFLDYQTQSLENFSEIFPHGNRLRRAFTLAEVLITLGIIGVVAALTIPSLVANHQEKATVSQLKKAYSTMSNALVLAMNEHGTVDQWGLTASGAGSDITGAANFYEKISPYLVVLNDCKNKGGCFYDGYYNTLGTKKEQFAGTASNFYTFTLTDGTAIAIWTTQSSTCTNDASAICAVLFVDINGKKKPNTTGRDGFWFRVRNNRIVPYGTTDEEFQSCAYIDGTYPSRTCTAWVLYNENLDYMHCKGLSWDGKKKCK